MKNPGIKRPFFPLPADTELIEYMCVQLSIPKQDDYKIALMSCLSLLTYWFNWERDNDQRGAAVANVWKEVINNMNWYNACGGTNPPYITRITDTGELEVSYDGGETWESGDELDPRITSPKLPAKTYPPGTDIKCAAADNMVVFIQEALDEAMAAIELGTGITAVIASILAIVASVLSFGTLAPLATALAASMASFGSAAIAAAFTAEVWEDLRCLFFDNLPADGNLSQADVDTIYSAAGSTFSGIAGTIIQSYIAMFGPVGLTNAGRIGSADGDECAECLPTIMRWLNGYGASGMVADTAQIHNHAVWNSGSDYVTSVGYTSNDGVYNYWHITIPQSFIRIEIQSASYAVRPISSSLNGIRMYNPGGTQIVTAGGWVTSAGSWQAKTFGSLQPAGTYLLRQFRGSYGDPPDYVRMLDIRAYTEYP